LKWFEDGIEKSRIITEAVEAVKDWQALRVKPEIGRQEMDRFINLF
jgi:hypothetical protein